MCSLLLCSCSSYFSKEPIARQPGETSEFRAGVLKYLDTKIENDSDKQGWYLEKARQYQLAGWPEDALEVLNTAIALDTGAIAAYVLRQAYFIDQEQYKKALKDIAYLQDKGLDTDYIVNSRLTALYGEEQWREFHQEVKEFTGDLSSYNRTLLSRYYLSEGDSLLAIRHAYLNYLNHPLADAEVIELVGLLTASGFSEKAMTILGQLDTEDESVQVEMASVLMQTGQLSEGIEILQNLSNEGNKEALSRLHTYYLSRNQLDAAITLNTQYVQQYDSSVVTLHRLGQLYQQKRYWSSALRIYQAILKKDPDNEEAIKESGKVSGNIAYLRSLKTQRSNSSAENQ